MTDKKLSSLLVPVSMFASIIFLWAISAGATLFFLLGPTPSAWIEHLKPGEFGDLFGSINALFSGLAFAGLIYTIILQKQELSLQRKELISTRIEIRGQREQLEKQTIALNLQNFENTFFQLLRFHSEITASLEVTDSNNVRRSGRDSFRSMLTTLERRLQKIPDAKDIEDKTRQAYESFYKDYQSVIGHYFRNLYHLINLVDKIEISTNKRIYTNLIRAQLSTYELALLFYNCLSTHGVHTLKPLAESYALFKDLPETLLFSISLKNQFSESAFE